MRVPGVRFPQLSETYSVPRSQEKASETEKEEETEVERETGEGNQGMCNTEQWMTAKQKGRWRVGRWRDMRALGL